MAKNTEYHFPKAGFIGVKNIAIANPTDPVEVTPSHTEYSRLTGLSVYTGSNSLSGSAIEVFMGVSGTTTFDFLLFKQDLLVVNPLDNMLPSELTTIGFDGTPFLGMTPSTVIKIRLAYGAAVDIIYYIEQY